MALGIGALQAQVKVLDHKIDSLARILVSLQETLEDMPTKQELDDAVAQVVSGVNNLGDAMVAAFTRLEAKIGQGVDVTTDVAGLKSLAQQVADLTAKAAAEAADNPPPTP